LRTRNRITNIILYVI